MADEKKDRDEKKEVRKVAIVGGGPSRTKAPFKKKSWEIWAFSSRKYRYPRIHRWFELHAMTDLRQQLATRKAGRRSFRNYMKFMKRLKCPVYMQRKSSKIKTSVAYPLKEAIKRFGRCYTSTASYMIALAIMEEYDVIGLWGVDLKGQEYVRQRKAIKYLLSVARQKGIRVVFPKGSGLRIPKKPKCPSTKVLYAYDWRSPGAWWRDRIRRRKRIVKKTRRRRRKIRRVKQLHPGRRTSLRMSRMRRWRRIRRWRRYLRRRRKRR